jgi:hypothetical protein
MDFEGETRLPQVSLSGHGYLWLGIVVWAIMKRLQDWGGGSNADHGKSVSD